VIIAVAPTRDIRGSTEIQEAVAAVRPWLPIARGARLLPSSGVGFGDRRAGGGILPAPNVGMNNVDGWNDSD
jgi:hypothetical protein